MKTIYHLESNFKLKQSVICIGNFDGVHKGHQEIIRQLTLTAKKRNCPSVAVSFEPHPGKVLYPKIAPKIIKTQKQKRDLLRQAGLDYYYVINFTPQFAKTNAKDFVKNILIDILNAKEIFVGENFAFSKNRQGNVDFLKSLENKYNYTTHAVKSVMYDNKIISSTRIRETLKNGDVETAEKLLGRYYYMEGIVVRGKQLGAKLGFPTANITSSNELVPHLGVYATYTILNNKKFKSITNIGIKPTFGGNEIIVETHIFDFDKDIYGELIQIQFVSFIRPEIKFDNINILIENIEKDCKKAKKILK
jgi:riboflavin kinase/FMN adenylyltransferase